MLVIFKYDKLLWFYRVSVNEYW